MNISDVELYRTELAGASGAARSLVVRVVSESGHEGWGETCDVWRAGELAARRRALLAVLAGREACDIESILALDALGDPAVACGVEMALWSLLARSVKLPLFNLIGGGYRTRLPMSVRLPVATPDQVAALARALAAQAIGSLVISGSGQVESDLKLVAAAREACPRRVQLRFDAQGSYGVDEAIAFCSRLSADSVQFVLDPLVAGAREQLSAVHARSGVPLGIFEGIASPADVAGLPRDEAAGFVVVDPTRVGGISRARQCVAVAEACGQRAVLRCEGVCGLGLAAGLHLMAATPGFASGYECGYPLASENILADRLRVVDGMLVVPSLPGLGVEVDRDKLERFQART